MTYKQTHKQMENIKEKLKTINGHITNVYSERDLKLDEIKDHLQKEFEKKVLFHKEKRDTLINKWFEEVKETYNVGTIILHNRGYRHYGKTFSFYIVNSVMLVPGELPYRRYDYSFDDELTPKHYDVIVEVVEVGTTTLLSKIDRVVVDRIYIETEGEFDTKPKVLCNVSDVPNYTKKHKLQNKMNHKLCMDIYKIQNEEVTDVQSTKDLLKKFGIN